MKITKEQQAILKNKFNLSKREIDIIIALFDGKTATKDISKELGVTIATTKQYLHVLSIKTNQKSKISMLVKLLDSLDLE